MSITYHTSAAPCAPALSLPRVHAKVVTQTLDNTVLRGSHNSLLMKTIG